MNQNKSHSSKNEFVCSLFGRIQDTIMCFRDYLTFKNVASWNSLALQLAKLYQTKWGQNIIYNNVCQIAGYNLGVLKKVVQLSAPGTIDTILNYGRCNIMNQGKPKVTRSRSEWIRKYVNYQSTFLFSDVMIFILPTITSNKW